MKLTSIPLMRRWGSSWRRRQNSHFRFELGGRTYAYCYIRKNGCSSFKRLLLDLAGNPQNQGSPIDVMTRNFLMPDLSAVRLADHRIVVVRHPVERLASLFRNKFIMRQGAEDILRDYRCQMRADPWAATFDQFSRYAVERSTDPHCWAVHQHLLPVDYDVAVTIENLSASMGRLFGSRFSSRYFGCRANSSSERLERIDGAGRRSAAELGKEFQSTGIMPDTASLTANGRGFIEKAFAEDVAIHRRVKDGEESLVPRLVERGRRIKTNSLARN